MEKRTRSRVGRDELRRRTGTGNFTGAFARLMASAETPLSYLPFAAAGFLAGVVLAIGSGRLLHQQWTRRGASAVGEDQIAIEGAVTDARWRRSAAPKGPTRYLQVRVAGDDRGFLIAERDLVSPALDRLGIARRRQGALPKLIGTEAIVYVDSALGNAPRPYLSGLRINGRVVGTQKGDASGAFGVWQQWVVFLLVGGGTLLGLGMMSVSVHHFVLCVRYRRQT